MRSLRRTVQLLTRRVSLLAGRRRVAPTRWVHRDDLRDALAVAAAVGVVGMSFGALAVAAGLSLPITVGLSVLVLAGGSQFLAVAVVAAGGGPVAAVAGGLLLNARHLPFGLAVAPIVGDRWPSRALGAHLLIDEVVAFAMAREEFGVARARSAYWLCGVALMLFWNVGTVVGALAGSAVPDPDVFGLDAAFPAALLALLLPSLRRRDAQRVGAAAAAVALVATPFLPAGVPVLAGLLGLLAAGRGHRPLPDGPTRGGPAPAPRCPGPRLPGDEES